MESSEKVKKRRTRKKTVEIDSIDKLNINETDINSNKNEDIEIYSSNKETLEHVKTPFGKLIITEVKTNNIMADDELEEYYIKKFGINENKTSEIVKEENNVVYEPIKEETKNSKKNSSTFNNFTNNNKKVDKKHKILSKFINDTKTTWPDKTDIYCWWCCHGFDNMPLPCPVKYDIINKNYKVNGIFCSWPCVAAYSIDKYLNLTLVQQMKNEFEENTEEIIVAPSRYILKNFGGYKSIKDFRNLSNKKILIETEKISYINQDIAEIM